MAAVTQIKPADTETFATNQTIWRQVSGVA